MKSPGKLILILGGITVFLVCTLVGASLWVLNAAINEANRKRIEPALKKKAELLRDKKTDEEKINELLDKINSEKEKDPTQQPDEQL